MRMKICGVGAVVAGMLFTSSVMAADFGVAPVVEYPAPALPLLTGNVALWGTAAIPTNFRNEGWEPDDPCDFPEDDDADFCKGALGFGGDARMHYRFSDAHGVQLELLVDYLSSTSTDEDSSDPRHPLLHAAGGLHLISRSSPSHPWGAFGGLAATKQLVDDETPLHFFGGLEGAIINGAQTYFGQVGGVTLLGGDGGGDSIDALRNMVFGRLGVRHFFTPNSRLEGSIAGGYAPVYDHSDDTSTNAASWVQVAAEYEQKHETSPFSWFVGYQGDFVSTSEEDCCDESVMFHAAKIGVRMSIGPTLQYENDHGARTFTFPNLAVPIGVAAELN